MGDNHVGGGSSAGEEDELSSEGIIYGEAADMNGDSVDQVNFARPTKGDTLVPVNSEPNDSKIADDMFVDCPDEIETSESQNSEKDNLQDDHFSESDSGIKVQNLMAELELLRDTCEKSVAEKHIFEAERAGFMRELAELCSQLKVLNQQQGSPGEITDGAVNHKSGASLHEMMSECCKLVNDALNERTVADENFKGLYSVLQTKDQEIDFLNAKVAKVDSLSQTLSHLEDENKKLVEQLEKQGSIVENANTEIKRLSAEVEQEKNRFANIKEKLSMAVTKGKALVQHRDQLKQSLVEKTSQLEKCSVELQEKSSALEAVEQLKKSFAEKDAILQKCEEILSEVVESEELQPKDITEKLRWLADENRSLVDVSRQFDKLTDALLLFDFPESLASSELDTRVCWLAESFYLSKEEIAKTREVAGREIDHLTTILLAEEQEKNNLLEKMEGLTGSFEACERLQHELDKLKEAAKSEIERLTESLVEESQEKSYLQAELQSITGKYEAHEMLQHEVAEMKEASNKEIERLSKLLVEASQEKTYLQAELEGIRGKYGAKENLENEVTEMKEAAKNEIERLTKLLVEESQEKSYLQAELEGITGKYEAHESLQHDLAEMKEAADKEIKRLTKLLEEESHEKSYLQAELEGMTGNHESLGRLQHELAEMKEAANKEIEQLTKSLEEESQEKSYLQAELEGGRGKHEALERLQHDLAEINEAATKEIDRLAKTLLEESNEKSYLQTELEGITEKYNALERLQHELAEAKEAANKEIERLNKSLEEEWQEKSYLQAELEGVRVKYEAHESLQHELAETKEAATKEIERLTKSLEEESQKKSNLQAELEGVTGKYEALGMLQHELAEMKDAANKEIVRLDKSLLEESQEKNYLQAELEGLRVEYEEMTRKEFLVSLEKDKIVNLLLEASGLTDNGLEEFDFDDCLVKIKEQSCRGQSSKFAEEMIGRFQSLLYTSDLEMNLCKLVAEEDTVHRAEANHLSNELASVTQELNVVKEEKLVMQKSIEQMVSDELTAVTQELNTVKEEKVVIEKSFEQLEDRCASLKEKLSMAVKKGKGLHQDRENLKGSLNEKKAEIEKLKSELQQSTSAYDECQEKIAKLSLDVQRIPELETDLISTKERADQLEQFLSESNVMIQRIMHLIEDITTPVGLVFEDPEEKVKWLAGYLNDHYEVEEELRFVGGKFSKLLDEKKELELSKKDLEEKLLKEKEEASSLTSRFEEVSSALILAENNISKIMNERDLAEENGALAQEQLQNLKKEFSSHIGKLADAEKNVRSLEDSLSQAEKNVSLLAEENNNLQIGSADSENEIKKIRAEADSHVIKFSDAEKNIRSLEDSLSLAETNVSLLTEENNKLQHENAELEKDLKKFSEEAYSQATKLSEASLTIKSLEEKLLNAENNMASFFEEKKNAEQEILDLNYKLKSCMEELAGAHGSKENGFLELSGQLSHLHLLLRDDRLSSSIDQCFQEKIENLNKMGVLLKEMNGLFLEINSDVLHKNPLMEDDSSISTTLSYVPAIASDMEPMLNGGIDTLDSDSIVLHIEKMNESLRQKGKILSAKLDSFSALMDESVKALFKKLHLTKDGVISVMKYINSLKAQVEDMETDKQRHEDSISSLENDIKFLLSACASATQSLEMNSHRSISELRSIYERVELDDQILTNLKTVGGDDVPGLGGSHGNIVEKLSLATKHNQDISELNAEVINKLLHLTEEVHNKLQRAEETCGEISEERDLLNKSIIKLENDLKEQQELCQQTMVKLDDYQEKENRLCKLEEELSTASSKVQELEDSPLSASQVNSILSKINKVEVPDTFAKADPHEKLFYVIDGFSEYLQKISSLSHEKEELQLTIEKLYHESQLMKKEVEDHIEKEKESEKILTDLVELELGLQNIVRKFGGNNLMDGHKAAGESSLLPLVEKLVIATLAESENLKSKNDVLSSKVKLLEDSKQVRVVPTETTERTITLTSLSSQSEISEIQDTTSVGTSSSIPLVPSAAHARTMRKGSSDHLAISIDPESERLINKKDLDEDKGHAFKSLNTTGIIPRQGRAFADRVDGIWVSGNRALMSHPRGRLGVIAYWLVVHIWLLALIF